MYSDVTESVIICSCLVWISGLNVHCLVSLQCTRMWWTSVEARFLLQRERATAEKATEIGGDKETKAE